MVINIGCNELCPDWIESSIFPIAERMDIMVDVGSTILITSACLAVITIFYLTGLIKEIFTKERRFIGNGIKGVGVLFCSLLLVGTIGFCLYKTPYVLFYGTTWAMIEEFGPSALLKGVLSLAAVIPLFYLYLILSYFFPKKRDKPYFMVIVLSILSGVGNSIVIFIINTALNRMMSEASRRVGIESGLYIYYLLGIGLFTVSAMIVRKKLIIFTSDLVYDKRIEIIDKILKAPFVKLETLADGKIHAALNNDTETVSGFVNAFVNGLTGVITLITCFIYLGNLNLLGMFFSILIIVFAVGLFLKASEAAEKKFEQNRDIQNLFFKYINDMVQGFKELSINSRKRKEFTTDIRESCKNYRDTRVDGEFQFVGVSILGEILYIAVIGVVVFIFPLIFPNLQNNTLRNYVLVYLYMGGIVNQEIYLVPGIMRVLVSWRRINQFINAVSFEGEKVEPPEQLTNTQLRLELKDVKFTYKNANGEQFTVGPINCNFKSGEITFVSGGNGSGKSTLAKLLTGLYQPDEGQITVNGQVLDSEALGGYFTTIFSDFYLFDKMYGLDYRQKVDEIQKYLEVFRLQDKVGINKGRFSTVKLSTGQRKRLALLVSYLEDKPIYLFDEWAADQDPEFRKFFYLVLLPELKARGKMVIAITHDDRYFGEADQHLKMEMGQIVSCQLKTGCNGVEATGA